MIWRSSNTPSATRQPRFAWQSAPRYTGTGGFQPKALVSTKPSRRTSRPTMPLPATRPAKNIVRFCYRRHPTPTGWIGFTAWLTFLTAKATAERQQRRLLRLPVVTARLRQASATRFSFSRTTPTQKYGPLSFASSVTPACSNTPAPGRAHRIITC